MRMEPRSSRKLADYDGKVTIPIASESFSSGTDKRKLLLQASSFERDDHRSARNRATSSLCRLPEELLVHILIYAQIVLENSKTDLGWFTPWLSFITMCRHTWCIALTSPRLWSSVELGYTHLNREIKWLRVCQERGNPMALTMRLYWDRDYIHITPHVMNLADSLYALSIDTEKDGAAVDRGISCSTLAAVLRMTWRSLAHLTVHTQAAWNTLELSFLGGYSDSLVSLVLDGKWVLQSNLPQYPQLQHLEISVCDLGRSANSIKNFISTCTHLKTIKIFLTWAFHIGLPSQSTSMKIPCLSLPSLSSVQLRGHWASVMYVLSMLPNTLDKLFLETLQGQGELPVPPSQQAYAAARALAFARRTQPRTEYVTRLVCNVDKSKKSAYQSLSIHRMDSASTPAIHLENGPCLLQACFTSQALEIFLAASSLDYENALDMSLGPAEETYFDPITQIEFQNWKSWSSQSIGLTNFEIYLESRKLRGQTLRTLVVDTVLHPHGMEEQWLSAKLVDEVIYTTPCKAH